MTQKVETLDAPAAIDPYSQAVKSNGNIYVSGQLPINTKTGAMPQNFEAQARQSLENILAILASEGLTMNNIVKTTVMLQNIADFNKMNAVYTEYFSGVYPARSAFQVAALPKGALIEIEAVACKE